MTNITKKEAIQLARVEMEGDLPHRLFKAEFNEQVKKPYWIVVFVYVDSDGNEILRDPSTLTIRIDDETAEVSIHGDL